MKILTPLLPPISARLPKKQPAFFLQETDIPVTIPTNILALLLPEQYSKFSPGDGVDYNKALDPIAVDIINDAVRSVADNTNLRNALTSLEEDLSASTGEDCEILLQITPSLRLTQVLQREGLAAAARLTPMIRFQYMYRMPLGVWSPKNLCDYELRCWDDTNFSSKILHTITAFSVSGYQLPMLENYDPDIDTEGTRLTKPDYAFNVTYKKVSDMSTPVKHSPTIIKYSRVEREIKPIQISHARVILRDKTPKPPDSDPDLPMTADEITQNIAGRLYIMIDLYRRFHAQLLNFDLANML